MNFSSHDISHFDLNFATVMCSSGAAGMEVCVDAETERVTIKQEAKLEIPVELLGNGVFGNFADIAFDKSLDFNSSTRGEMGNTTDDSTGDSVWDTFDEIASMITAEITDDDGIDDVGIDDDTNSTDDDF